MNSFDTKDVTCWFAENGYDFPNCFSQGSDHSEEYNGFEMNPVVVMRHGAGGNICEAITDIAAVAEYLDDNFEGLVWTIYAHCVEGGVEAVHDFNTHSDAKRCFEQLNAYFGARGVK